MLIRPYALNQGQPDFVVKFKAETLSELGDQKIRVISLGDIPKLKDNGEEVDPNEMSEFKTFMGSLLIIVTCQLFLLIICAACKNALCPKWGQK